ncbi:hypothetical protein CROQUDRAFT_99836 [Cronartium quercuum f. sp. fusiforme G11]|uniref:Uncharacterized protein n=1 Tax=Cronartium quercuum f. sp. fusiforme G11 TaxID=708437 RepID=A0A9P6T7P0_9BASI|nr:hypothetical protein CROQUDRAFT_99836 [Cronartium quercuum f. sp. fusiforme G11]
MSPLYITYPTLTSLENTPSLQMTLPEEPTLSPQVPDPELILRQANATRCQEKEHEQSTASDPDPLTTLMTGDNPSTTVDAPKCAHGVDPLLTRKLLWVLLLAQTISLTQAAMQAERMSKMEEALVCLSLSDSRASCPDSISQPPLAPGHIDLMHFKTEGRPIFKGPYHEVEPFLKWASVIHLYFITKQVTHAAGKITLVGHFLQETNVLAFYTNAFDELIKGSWEEFQRDLFQVALPANWRNQLLEKAHHLKMSDSEGVRHYSTQECMTQSLLNYEKISLSD